MIFWAVFFFSSVTGGDRCRQERIKKKKILPKSYLLDGHSNVLRVNMESIKLN